MSSFRQDSIFEQHLKIMLLCNNSKLETANSQKVKTLDRVKFVCFIQY